MASSDSLDVLPLREDLIGRTPYGAPQLEAAARLNVNENPYPPSDALVADIARAVADVAATLNRYPDREALAVREALVGYLADREGHRTGADRIWVANGSNEVMQQFFQAFGGPGRTALGFAPTYSMYPDYCRDTFTRWVTVPREDDFSIDPDEAVATITDLRPAVVVLASPNNPTGTALPQGTLRAICDSATGMVVVDEAYAEFRRPGTPTALELLEEYPRLVVTRTMSKAFAMAGARLGYLVASPSVVDAVRLVRLPYHLSAVSQAVACAALAHAEELQADLALLRDERDRIAAWLADNGLRPAESDANFVLFGTFADRHAVWQALLDRGVLIRETGPDGWLRVSVGTPEEMTAFREALTDVRARGIGAATPSEEESA